MLWLIVIALMYILLQAFQYLSFHLDYGEAIFGNNAYRLISIDGVSAFFAPFFYVVIFASELSGKTLKNLIAEKCDRRNVWIAKWITLVMSVMGFNAVLVASSGCVFSILCSWNVAETGISVANMLLFLLKQTAVNISMLSLPMVLSLYIHSEAVIILTYFGGSIIESMLASFFAVSTNAVIHVFVNFFPTYFMESFLYTVQIHNILAWCSILVTSLGGLGLSALLFAKMDLT